jgi:hypothetical protein
MTDYMRCGDFVGHTDEEVRRKCVFVRDPVFCA